MIALSSAEPNCIQALSDYVEIVYIFYAAVNIIVQKWPVSVFYTNSARLEKYIRFLFDFKMYSFLYFLLIFLPICDRLTASESKVRKRGIP